MAYSYAISCITIVLVLPVYIQRAELDEIIERKLQKKEI